MNSLMSEWRFKWTGLDKCICICHGLRGLTRRGMACMRTNHAYFMPQLPLQPTSLSKNLKTFLPSSATGLSVVWVSATTWCCHQGAPSAPWHTRWRDLREVFCGTDLQQLWHQVPKPLTLFHDPLWLYCFTTANYQAVWNPMQGLGVFLQSQFVPKATLVFCRIHSRQQTLATETGLSHLGRTPLGITLGSPTMMLHSSTRAVAQPTANVHTGLVSKCYTSCPHW